MSKQKADVEQQTANPKLLVLLAKREALFELVQNIFDTSVNIDVDAGARETFLAGSANIDVLRTDFMTTLDNYNACLLESKPLAKPDYKCLIAFEQLYSRIKRFQTLNLSVTPADSLPQKGKPRLPAIELVSFAGDIRSWPLFYASFKTTVHDNPSLSDAEKLYYLLGKLSGKAKSICSGISPTADNYNVIIQTLIDKYEDKRMLASAYMNQLFDFKPLNNATANSLESFNDQFVSAVRALNNLKIDNMQDLFILHVALKKLDSETVRAFETSVGSRIPSFDELVQFVTNRTKVLERTPIFPAAFSSVNNNNSASKFNKQSDASRRKENYVNKPPKYQTYVSTAQPASNKCLCTNICHQHLFKCPDFHTLSPEQRFNVVKQYNACINCLSTRHKVSLCKSELNCRFCAARHHSLVHFTQNQPVRSAVTVDARSMPVLPDSVCKHIASESQAATVAAAAINPSLKDVALCATSIAAPQSLTVSDSIQNEQCTVLLATAQVVTYDSRGDKHVLRALLDSASQCHFITKDTCKTLGISVNDIGRTVVKGFGGTEKLLMLVL